MQKKFTSKCMTMHACLLSSLLMMTGIFNDSFYAQSLCANESPLFIENFGAGTTPGSNPDVISTALTFKETGYLDLEGVYRVIDNTQQNPAWHSSPDHTGNTNGRMLVINGNGTTFYRHVVNNPQGFQAGYYSVGMFFMNVNKNDIQCEPGFSPNISFLLEYQAQDNSWVAVGGSTVSVPFQASPTWSGLESIYTIPINSASLIKNFRLSINDGTTGLCGNDFAIDDIQLAVCVDGGPLPVEFSNLAAIQKGAGVAIDWSTASEANSNYFDVERSIDRGSTWNLVTTTKASGNSSLAKKYSAFDTKQLAGLNYYRIKQVDLDGKFKYSGIVQVKVKIDRATASVISNPFTSAIGIDFLSKTRQEVRLTLFDISGKILAVNKMTIPTGASRMAFEGVNNIQTGLYLLKIVDENGNSLFNGKLFKR